MIVEEVDKNQVIKHFCDGSERVIVRDDTSYFYLRVGWIEGITESDAGTILDFWTDANKANGYARSFKLYNTGDGHTYVVKFRSKLIRNRSALLNPLGIVPVDEMRFKVIGYIAD